MKLPHQETVEQIKANTEAIKADAAKRLAQMDLIIERNRIVIERNKNL